MIVNSNSMDELDKKIIRSLQRDFPITSEPYKELARDIGIDENELIERINVMLENKIIRKIGAVLRHREVGYKSNVLCVWNVSADKLAQVAKGMSAHSRVSHCYERERSVGWDYNLYTMIHGISREECEDIAKELGCQYEIKDRLMLYTIRELKKTSMKYFNEDSNL